MIEVWKDIDSCNGLYQVNTAGSVRRYKAGKWYVLKPWKNKRGYLQVSLSVNGKRNAQLVHRLVLIAFKGHAPNMQANHINESIQDNRLENLEWVTPFENANHGTRSERIGNATYSRRIYRYFQLDSSKNVVDIHESKSILEKNGFAPPHVRNACKNGRQHKGFYWKRESIL